MQTAPLASVCADEKAAVAAPITTLLAFGNRRPLLLANIKRRMDAIPVLIRLRAAHYAYDAQQQSPEYDALAQASVALEIQIDARIHQMRESGCLLHVGCVA